MAIGDITNIGPDGTNVTVAVELLASRATVNSPPSGASAGLSTEIISEAMEAFKGVPDTMTLVLYSTAGTGVMTATARLWFYDPVAADWFPAGTGVDGTKGTINALTAMGETGADKIRHIEPIFFPFHCTRIYLEIVAIAGTGTEVKAHLAARRPGR